MKPELAKKVLETFKWYFDEDIPPSPDDLTKGQGDATGVIRHCIDSRLNEQSDLRAPKGTYFLASSAGAAVPPWQNGLGTDAQTVIDLGFSTINIKKADTIIIMGHTHCGANQAMFDALLSDTPESASFATRWMLPMAASQLKVSLKMAKSRDASDSDLLRLTEKTTVLQSMRNLYDYAFDTKTVSELVDNGDLHIIGAIRSLEKNADGKQTLSIFDPDKKMFRNIEEIKQEYDKAIKPPLHLVGDTTDERGAETNISHIETSIQHMLRRIRETGTQPQLMARL